MLIDETVLLRSPYASLGCTGADCYFNIVGDHLGQGYHQYRYAGRYYPE